MTELTQSQIDEVAQAWQDFVDAAGAGAALKRAIVEFVEIFMALPLVARVSLYVRLRRWIPERWAASMAMRWPLWLVKCL